MSHCFRAVRDVYLGHTLSATLELFGHLVAPNDESAERQLCISACETVLRYVRSAQHACGVLGLVAIDRSQEHLRMCLKNFSGTTATSNQERTVYSVAGLCYANALNRQYQGNTQLEELWMFAANCYDVVSRVRSNQTCPIRTSPNYLDPPIVMETRTALIVKASKLDAEGKLAVQAGKAWTSRFAACSAHFGRLVVVCATICDIYQLEQRTIPQVDKSLYQLLKYLTFSSQAAISLIERNAAICEIADSPHPVAVKGLAEMAAQRLLTAVELVAAKPPSPPQQLQGYNNPILQERQRIAAPWERNATALANLASGLSAVATQIAELRAAAAVPEQLLVSATKQIHDLTAEIEATANNDGDAAPHVREFTRVKGEIERVGDKLKAAQGSAASPEERAIQRYLTEAGKVRRETSPAHPHISECWLQAATHMRLSVDARATATTGADTQRVNGHAAYCKVYEKLAAGTFPDAANYFAKAARAGSLCVREVWLEAADLFQQVGEAYMQNVDQVATREWFNPAHLATPSALEMAQRRCAAACAACAEAMEGVPETDTGAIVNTLSSDRQAATAHTAASELDGGTRITLRMRYLLVFVERAALAQAAAVPVGANTVSGGTLTVLRALVDGILLLSQTCLLAVPSYPVGHLLHRAAPSAETVQQRDQLLRWLCDTVEDCYKHLHRAFEAHLAPDRHNKALDDILNSLRSLDSILWYVYPTESCSPTYAVQTYRQALQYQVLCRRYLTASDMVLADQLLARSLLLRAAQQHLQQPAATSLQAAVSNGLVRRAWDQAPGTPGPLPAELLLHLSADGMDASAAAKLPALVEAHYQSTVHQLAVDEYHAMPSQEATLRRKAVAVNGYVAQAIVELLTNGTPRSVAQTQRLHEQCARASRSATWCSLAVEALRNARTDVTALYERATQFVVLGPYLDIKSRQLKVDAQAQQMGDKAGTRLAEAAKALAANDLPLYELWRQAAEATVLLVEVTLSKPRCYGLQKLALTAAHSSAAMDAADLLGQRACALAAQTAHSTHARPSGESVAVASEARQRKRQRRDTWEGLETTRCSKVAVVTGVNVTIRIYCRSGSRGCCCFVRFLELFGQCRSINSFVLCFIPCRSQTGVRRTTMVYCFNAGIAVYLCHTRSAVHELHELLTSQNDESTEMKRCIAACNAVLCYVRSGQHACGVLGLLAIDRSQEHLRLCIDAWRGLRMLNSAGDTV
jgi:hypothetical protein